jgi:hypothetical protein
VVWTRKRKAEEKQVKYCCSAKDGAQPHNTLLTMTPRRSLHFTRCRCNYSLDVIATHVPCVCLSTIAACLTSMHCRVAEVHETLAESQCSCDEAVYISVITTDWMELRWSERGRVRDDSAIYGTLTCV